MSPVLESGTRLPAGIPHRTPIEGGLSVITSQPAGLLSTARVAPGVFAQFRSRPG